MNHVQLIRKFCCLPFQTVSRIPLILSTSTANHLFQVRIQSKLLQQPPNRAQYVSLELPPLLLNNSPQCLSYTVRQITSPLWSTPCSCSPFASGAKSKSTQDHRRPKNLTGSPCHLSSHALLCPSLTLLQTP